MGVRFPGSGRFVVAAVCCLAVVAGSVRAGSDPDVDVAIKTVQGVDGHTKEERAKYLSALDRYADTRQKLLAAFGKLLEANQPSVDSDWDRLAEAGEKSLNELKSAAPADKTNLAKFYQAELATWQTLKRINVPAAEEAESKLRKTVETVTPVVTNKLKVIVDEDRRSDDAFRKTTDRRKAIYDVVVAGLRVVNKAANPNQMLKHIVEDVLANLDAYRAGLMQIRVSTREKVALLKKYIEVKKVAGELKKAVETVKEDSTKKLQAARSDLKSDPIDDQAAVATQAQGWAKVIETHFNETIELVKKFNASIDGKLVGSADNDTKRLLGDYDNFKKQFDIWEDESEAIEDGLDELAKKIENLVDGNLKRSLKDNLAKCRTVLKECNSLRSDIKSEYESVLGDAGLK